MRLAAGVVAAALAVSLAASGHSPAPTPAESLFEPPAPGTYELAVIQAAPDGDVLDTAGRPRRLSEFMRGRWTLLGLVYTRCGDPDGCPVATWAFGAVRRLLRDDPALEREVRLVTLSFDPAHDVPAVMRRYAARIGGTRPGAEWHFLTTPSRAALEPILDDLAQDLRVAAGSTARPGTEAFTHTLKVFLVDPEGRVREIYSNAWLVPRMIVNDILTLRLEALARGR
jgi:cytochrome oxidase Cu insertion factor (SCO1/SenC/PrrC family)